MPKTDITVRELVAMIDRGELRLPELQRRYVWPATRVRDLLDSLYRGYPSGTILVWETEENVPDRDFAVEQRGNGFGTNKLLLDGQQRLTSLSAVLRAQPIRVRGRVRPVEIAFNLDHPDRLSVEVDLVEEVDDEEPRDEDLREDDPFLEESDVEEEDSDQPTVLERVSHLAFVVSSRSILSDRRWVKVSDIFDSDVTDWEILKHLVDTPDNPLWEKYSRRLQAVRKIADYPYVMHVVERALSYEEVADIFVRVNSLGMKLRGSDLALAQITARWRGALEVFEAFSEECSKVWTAIDTGLLVRTLVAFATGQSRFRTVNTIGLDEMQDAWAKAKTGLRFAVNFLRTNADIEDKAVLSSWLFLIPISIYAVQKELQLSEAEERGLAHWLLVANATGHYTRGSTESILDVDLSTIMRRDGGPDELLENVQKRFGRTRFSAADFAGVGERNPLFATTYLALRKAGAKDWRSGLGLALDHVGRTHRIQTHHIFPKAKMKDRNGREVNEIANLAFLSGSHNQAIGAKLPEKYLPEVISQRGDEALTVQGIPIDPDLWRKENFERFLEHRRAHLAEIVNVFLDAVSSSGGRGVVDAEHLIAGGETALVELKESAKVNTRTGAPDKALEDVIVKTVAGFLNAHGGNLIIGVNDDLIPVGLEADLKALGKRPNLDGYEQFLRNLMNNSVGRDLCARVGVEFPNVGGITVCALTIPSSPRPVWITGSPGKTLYVRSGNTTQPLDSEQAHSYVGERFGSQ